MEAIEIKKISQVFTLFEEKLKAGAANLRQSDKVGVERINTLDGYVLKHPRGIFGILYNGSNYSKREEIKNNLIFMKKDILIGVVSIIRFMDDPQLPAGNSLMMPSDYTELVEDIITGTEILNQRPEYERKIFPISTELIGEDKGVWKYLTTFLVPADFIEKQFRDK